MTYTGMGRLMLGRGGGAGAGPLSCMAFLKKPAFFLSPSLLLRSLLLLFLSLSIFALLGGAREVESFAYECARVVSGVKDQWSRCQKLRMGCGKS